MALKKLEELGYKPKKGTKKEDEQKKHTEEILKEVQSSEAKQEILNLLLEALSEPDPREILVNRIVKGFNRLWIARPTSMTGISNTWGAVASDFKKMTHLKRRGTIFTFSS